MAPTAASLSAELRRAGFPRTKDISVVNGVGGIFIRIHIEDPAAAQKLQNDIRHYLEAEAQYETDDIRLIGDGTPNRPYKIRLHVTSVPTVKSTPQQTAEPSAPPTVTLADHDYRELRLLAEVGASQGRKARRESCREFLARLDAKVKAQG